MKNIFFIMVSVVLFTAFSNADTEVSIDGIWVNENTINQSGKTYLIIRGDEIQLYLESFWSAGYNQYFGGEKLIAQNSLFIHVNNYLTISPNTGNAVRYRNCPKLKVQRIIMHQIEDNNLQLEIIPGSSIYDSFGFFDDKILDFKKLTPGEFEKVDPIFNKVPELLMSTDTKIKDCSAFKSGY